MPTPEGYLRFEFPEGVIFAYGDPLGVEGRRPRVEILEQILKSQTGTLRIGDLSLRAQEYLGEKLDEMGRTGDWLAGIADKKSVPFTIEGHAIITLSGGGKQVSTLAPLVTRKIEAPDNSVPTVRGWKTSENPEGVPREQPPEVLNDSFYSFPARSGIVLRTQLMTAFLQHREKEASTLQATFWDLAGELFTKAGVKLPEPRSGFSELPTGVRKHFDWWMESDAKQNGFADAESGKRWLLQSEVESTSLRIQLSFKVFGRNGNPTGGSFTITP